MSRKALVDVVADGILDQIISGKFQAGDRLPSEAEIREEYDVSRVTAREALRSLSAQKIIQVSSGIGAVVCPLAQWQSLAAILRYRSARGDDGAVALQLIEVRRMFEVEAAARAAGNLDAGQLKDLAGWIESMRQAHSDDDVQAFVRADLAFHEVILHGSGNIFLASLFVPLQDVLADRREQTSRVSRIQINAIAEHEAILRALRAEDSELARAAMTSHMDQTLEDLKTYILDA